MKLNRTGNPLNRDTRNKDNENWEIIEDGFKDVGNDISRIDSRVDGFVEEVSNEALGKVVDNAKLNWKEPVNSFNNLPSSAQKGDTRMAKDTGKVYRFDGSIWVEIQQIDAGPVNELDNRLTTQLADIENMENYEVISRKRKRKGHVVFISDDGHKGDWEVLKPIFEQAGVPFCVAIVTGWMDPDSNRYDTKMTWDQVRYLQNEMGCEILSHSRNHTDPRITESPESYVREELEESRNELIRQGLNVQSFRVPGNNMHTRERNLIREYYRSNVVSNPGEDGLNHMPYETFELKSIWIDNESYGGAKEFDYYKDHIDRANKNGALLIISMHGYALDGVQILITDVVNYAKNNSNVTTLREALNNSGNVFETGDYTKTTRADRQGTNHFAVGADGTLSGSLSVSKNDEYDITSKWYEFPFGITVCAVSGNNEHIADFPEGRGGLLTTVRPHNSAGHTYQTYRIYRRNDTYYRIIEEDGSFGEWSVESPRTHFNTDRSSGRSFNDGIGDYKRGVTYNEVKTTNIDFDQAPGGIAGVRITYKIGDSGVSRYNYQEYVPTGSKNRNVSYIRYATGGETWSDWESTSYVILPEENNNKLSDAITDFPLGVTYSIITSDNSINAPEGRQGTLVTHRLSNTAQVSYSFQKYYLNNRTRVYKRHPTGLTTWGSWHLINGD